MISVWAGWHLGKRRRCAASYILCLQMSSSLWPDLSAIFRNRPAHKNAPAAQYGRGLSRAQVDQAGSGFIVIIHRLLLRRPFVFDVLFLCEELLFLRQGALD